MQVEGSVSSSVVEGQSLLPDGFTSCFACGTSNPVGLQLFDIRISQGLAYATLRAREGQEGYPGLLHGGLAVTALDELMGYACRVALGQWAVTAKLESRFRKPMPLPAEYRLEAGVEPGESARRAHAWGRLCNVEGEVLMETCALFVVMPLKKVDRI